MLSIKNKAAATIYEIEESEDSKGDDIREDLEPSKVQRVLATPLPARSLR